MNCVEEKQKILIPSTNNGHQIRSSSYLNMEVPHASFSTFNFLWFFTQLFISSFPNSIFIPKLHQHPSIHSFQLIQPTGYADLLNLLLPSIHSFDFVYVLPSLTIPIPSPIHSFLFIT